MSHVLKISRPTTFYDNQSFIIFVFATVVNYKKNLFGILGQMLHYKYFYMERWFTIVENLPICVSHQKWFVTILRFRGHFDAPHGVDTSLSTKITPHCEAPYYGYHIMGITLWTPHFWHNTLDYHILMKQIQHLLYTIFKHLSCISAASQSDINCQ